MCGKNFLVYSVQFSKSALNLCIFTHAPVPHSKLQAEFFANVFPPTEERGGENYNLLS